MRLPILLATASLCALSLSARAQTSYEGSFGFPGFDGREELHLLGAAEVTNGELILTPPIPGEIGAAWFAPFAPRLESPWFCEFTVRFDGTSDGLAFVIQNNDSWTQGGCAGSCLGYDGLERSLAVELDTFSFPGEFGEDHVSIQTRFADSNSSDDSASLAHAVLTQDLNDGEPHRVRIAHDGSTMRVWVDGTLEITQAVDLAAGILSSNDSAVLGFTASTGGATAMQTVTDWAFGRLGIQVDQFQTVTDAITVGDAFFSQGALRLTQNIEGQAGAAWYMQYQPVTEPWVTSFDFRLDGTADGFAFVVQDQSLFAIGAGGSGMGYASNGADGIARSLAVEFDTFSFSGEFAEDHVSIQTRFDQPNSSDDADSLAHAVLPMDLNDNEVHRAMIAYDGRTLYVSVDGVPVTQAVVDFTDMSSGESAIVGFTGGTGAAAANQDILNWRFGGSFGCLNTDVVHFIFDQSATPGDTLVLHWTPSGSQPLDFEWRLNGQPVTDGGPISGAETNTLVISPVGPEHHGQWDYGVSNACSGVGSGFFLTVLPACDPDVNQDGNVDQDDVGYLINVVGGGENGSGIDPDFNRDGNVDQDDISALINVVAGGPCP